MQECAIVYTQAGKSGLRVSPNPQCGWRVENEFGVQFFCGWFVTMQALTTRFEWDRTMIRSRQVNQVLLDVASVKPDEGPDRLFQLTMLHALLLPPRSRDVFVLTEMHGYTLPEVAKVLGMSKEDVKKHLRRARREIQSI